MGKSKKRIFNKGANNLSKPLKRNEIINTIISDIRSNNLKEETKKLISLFGISSEELTEAGASYEEISVFGSYFF